MKSPGWPVTDLRTALQEIDRRLPDTLNALAEWLRIPSISTDPAHAGDVRAAAEWLVATLQRCGLTRVTLHETPGHPVVTAEWLGAGPGGPTVLVYGHYDVQPAAIHDGWSSPPFVPETRDGRMYARGASDDKGQVIAQILAIAAVLAPGTCPVNLKLVYEGEEEIGSPHFHAFLLAEQAHLGADVALVCDTQMRSPEQPTITTGLRGLMAMEVTVSGPQRDLHSGLGGPIHNPAQALASMIAALHDASGRVAVPGFYEDVRELSPAQRAEVNRAAPSATEWQALMGDLPAWGEPGYTPTERASIRPTLEINGLSAGYAGAGFKTVIGASATAKISCRLVPDQSSERVFALVRNYLTALAPPTVRVSFSAHGLGEPAVTPDDLPALQSALAAYRVHWPDTTPLKLRGGGSIPIVADLQATLGIHSILMGFALPDSAAHGPDENLPVEQIRRGAGTIAAFLLDLAARHTEAHK
jgi:acetylornithine deacetylase/succinyl-diaminopimelate desuccinylase-like protein